MRDALSTACVIWYKITLLGFRVWVFMFWKCLEVFRKCVWFLTEPEKKTYGIWRLNFFGLSTKFRTKRNQKYAQCLFTQYFFSLWVGTRFLRTWFRNLNRVNAKTIFHCFGFLVWQKSIRGKQPLLQHLTQFSNRIPRLDLDCFVWTVGPWRLPYLDF